MPIYKRCSRCGKRILVGTTCDCIKQRYKEYDRFCRDQESKSFYGSREWQQARSEALDLDSGIDVYVWVTEGKILLADTVHHIVPLKDDRDKRLDVNNLISLNHDTHSMIEQMYRNDKAGMIEKLKKMLLQYRKEKR